jgi:Zn-dependent protease
MKHIDPFGTMLLPLLLYLTGFVFGYAKPVPVDFAPAQSEEADGLGGAGRSGRQLCHGAAVDDVRVLLRGGVSANPSCTSMARAGINVNAVMCAFNLLPIPPLDGGRVLTSMLPMELAYKFARIERYGFFIFMGC